VFVPVTVVCEPGAFVFLSVTITQRVGSDIASGSAATQLTCTGSVQTFELAVTPTENAFKKGVAFGDASLVVCTFTCHTAEDQHTIEIVRR
jgi:hypothetical protein